MKELLTGIVDLKEGQSTEEFSILFHKFLQENGWSYNENNVIPLVQPKLNAKHSPTLGSAIFHENYTGLADEDSNTKRRYFLQRTWDANLPILCTFMMNPSAADEVSGDPTVDFMLRYAKYNDYGSLIVVNTSPIIKGSEVTISDFVVDDKNYFYIQNAVNVAQTVVLGWGKEGQKWGIPTLMNNFPLKELLSKNIYKLRMFGFGSINGKVIFPKHPHPQLKKQRFPIDAKLCKVSLNDFNMLFK